MKINVVFYFSNFFLYRNSIEKGKLVFVEKMTDSVDISESILVSASRNCFRRNNRDIMSWGKLFYILKYKTNTFLI